MHVANLISKTPVDANCATGPKIFLSCMCNIWDIPSKITIYLCNVKTCLHKHFHCKSFGYDVLGNYCSITLLHDTKETLTSFVIDQFIMRYSFELGTFISAAGKSIIDLVEL